MSRTKHRHWWIEETPDEPKRTVRQWFQAIREHVRVTPEFERGKKTPSKINLDECK